jgi:hypothetical protein
VALYLALATWVPRGGRILMSPIDDDVVLFTVLAAGLRPVMACLSPDDGNIDLDAVPDDTWETLDAVLTTNLYGLPDRLPALRTRCEALGIPLIEDAAHALYTDVEGRPVGSYGEAAAFSLSKHVGGVGGVVAFADSSRRDELVRLRERVVRERPLRVRAEDVLRPRALAGLERLRLRAALRTVRARLGREERRGQHRMPLRCDDLRAALAEPDLDRLDPWVRVDKHDYRLSQRDELLASTVERLRDSERDRAARTAGVAMLRDVEGSAAAVAEGDPMPLFRVPLLVRDREAAGAVLAAAGHPLHYVYDPPLDDYAGDFVERSPDPAIARWWGRHVLPVDPLLADRALAALRSSGDAVKAVAPPRGDR